MKNFSIEIKWGIIFVLLGILWSLLEKILGYHDEKIAQQVFFSMLFIPIAFLCYFLAIKEKKHQFYNNKMTWKQGFVSGILMTIVVAILSPISQFIVTSFISPNYFDRMITLAVQNNRMNQTEALAYFNRNSYMLQSVYFALSTGIVTAAIVSFFIRNKK